MVCPKGGVRDYLGGGKGFSGGWRGRGLSGVGGGGWGRGGISR